MSTLIGIDQNACVNFRFTRMKCQACRNVCPKLTEQSGQLGLTCTDCGLCISVCPADAITSESYSANSFERLFNETGAAILVCRKRHADSEWPCLGFLSARLLLALSCSSHDDARPIFIDNAGCAACNPNVSEHVEFVIRDTNTLLQALGKKTVTVLNPQNKIQIRPKAISRRQFFGQLFGAAVTTVTEVVASSPRGKSRLPRLAWFDQYAKPGMQDSLSADQRIFKSLTISDVCDGCGICAGICPRKALTVQMDDHMLDIQHDPLACVDCGVCSEHCPQKAIEMYWAEGLNKRVAGRVELPTCRECGNYFQPVGGHSTCMDCLLKAKIQMIW